MDRFSNFLSGRLPFYYGYLMVPIAVLAQVCSSPGQTFAISAFTPVLQSSLGLSSSQLAAAYMLGTFLAAFPLMLIGPLADRFGLRWTTAGVAAALAGACAVASLASGFLSILLAFLLLRCLGQGALTLLSGNIVSMWFQLRLGAVNSLMSLGGAVAFATVPVVLLQAIESLGWRQTYLAMGGVILVALVPLLIFFLRDRPEDLGQSTDGLTALPSGRPAAASRTAPLEFTLRQAACDRTLWILGLNMGLWAMIGTGIVFYALPIFEAYGIPSAKSQLLFATFSTAMLVSQVAGGILADRLPMHRLLACGFALLAAGALCVPLTDSTVQVHLFAGLFGAGQGLAIASNSTMWVRYYGRRHLGKIRGTVWCTTVAGSGCGPFILGTIHDLSGSFTPGLWLFVALLSPLAPLALLATPPGPRWRTADADR